MASLKIPYETIDDLIYDARVGDIDSLKQNIEALSSQNSCSALDVLTAAIDIDDDGEGTGCCLLHWPAANGNAETLTYILSLIPSSSSTTTTSSSSSSNTPSSQTAHPLLSLPNTQGNTPLHWATLNLHLDCVKALVAAGADVNAKNKVGQWVGFEAERVYEEESASVDDAADAKADEKDEAAEQPEHKETEKQKKAREVVDLLLGSEGFREEGEGEPSAAAAAVGNEQAESSSKAKEDVEMSG